MMEKLYIDKPERSHPHKCALQPREGERGREILKRKDPSHFPLSAYVGASSEQSLKSKESIIKHCMSGGEGRG